MKKILISPSKYVQGEGELYNLASYLEDFSKKVLLVSSKTGRERVQDYLNKTFEDNSLEVIYGEFNKECTKNEIKRMEKLADENNCGVFIGLGGGKVIDTAKAIRIFLFSLKYSCSINYFIYHYN